MRQKVTLASSGPTSTELKQGQIGLETKFREKVTLVQQQSHPVKFIRLLNADRVDTVHAMHSIDQNTEVKEIEGSDLVDSVDRRKSSTQSQNVASIRSCMLENGYDNGDWLWPKTDHTGTNCMGTCHETCKRLANGCSKVNENNSGAGALRYALHLRFLCPPPKKKSHLVQRCKSDPFFVPQNTSLDKEVDRRFYLYNDLRVVFPQRHSDADEGKV